jgi:hypothetical protein
VPSLVDVHVLDIRLIRADGHITREYFGERPYKLGRVRAAHVRAQFARSIERLRATMRRVESRYWAERAAELERQAAQLRRDNAGVLHRAALPARSREERRMRASWSVQAAAVQAELERLAAEAAEARARADGQEDPRSAELERELANLRREELDARRELDDSQRELDSVGSRLSAERREPGNRDVDQVQLRRRMDELRESQAGQRVALADLGRRIAQRRAELERLNLPDPLLSAAKDRHARVAETERRLAPLLERASTLDQAISAALADPAGSRAPVRLLRERADLAVRIDRLRAVQDVHRARSRAGEFVVLHAGELIERLVAAPVPAAVARDLRGLFTADPSTALRAARVLLDAGRTSRGRAAGMIAAVNERFGFGWDESVQRALQDAVRQSRSPAAGREHMAHPSQPGTASEQASGAASSSTPPGASEWTRGRCRPAIPNSSPAATASTAAARPSTPPRWASSPPPAYTRH